MLEPFILSKGEESKSDSHERSESESGEAPAQEPRETAPPKNPLSDPSGSRNPPADSPEPPKQEENSDTENPPDPSEPPSDPDPPSFGSRMSDEQPRGVKPKEPEAFDGSREKAPTFVRSVQQYVRLMSHQFRSEEDKIVWALSYMSEGRAARWANMIFENHIETTDREKKIATWGDFVVMLRKEFISTNEIMLSAAQLRGLKQGEKSVDNYNTEFMDLMIRLGITDETALIAMYRTGLNYQIAEKVQMMENIPTGIDEWMKRASNFYNQGVLLRIERGSKGDGNSQGSFRRSPNNRFRKKGNARNRVMLTDKEKEEYRRNGKCFNCGKQGHRSFECPDKKDKGKIREVTKEDEESTSEDEDKEEEGTRIRKLLKGIPKNSIKEYLEDSDSEDFS